jgi:hypothetical protein
MLCSTAPTGLLLCTGIMLLLLLLLLPPSESVQAATRRLLHADIVKGCTYRLGRF